MSSRLDLAALTACIFLVAGCASSSTIPGGQSPSGLRVVQSVSAPSATCAKPYEFVLNSAADLVTLYSQSKKCGSISYAFLEAQGLGVDASENLYVVDTGNSDVVEFKPPYNSSPVKTYKDPSEYPVAAAACKGYLAVTNILSTTGGAGSVTVYRSGKVTNLSDPNVAREYFVACDGQGNLYTDGITLTGASVVNEFKGGAMPAKDLSAITPQFPGGLAWKNGALWVDDQLARTVGLWGPPFAKPEKTIDLSGSVVPVDLAVSPSGDRILTADAGLNAAEFYNLSGKNIGSLPGPASAVAYSR